MKFGKGALVTPQTAASYYDPQGTTHTDVWGPDRPAEIKATARALGHDPDLIYAYVHNKIEIVPMFGLQKGAVGAIIDGSGTAFDQAHLMVELLRASNVTARYKFGTISLSGAQFENWFDISDAKAACNLLGNGGIPGSVNSTTDCASLSGQISSVMLAHVWVEADLPGGTYVFDPAFKGHAKTAGILDVPGTMGYGGAAAFMSLAVTGASSVTLQGAPAVRGINKSGIDGELAAYAGNLINEIKTNHAAKSLDELIGDLEIAPATIPSGGLRQSSLPYASASATWTDIPDAYRTQLRLIFVDLDYPFFVDAIYGRRIVVQVDLDWDIYKLRLQVDGKTVGTTSYLWPTNPPDPDALPHARDNLPIEVQVNHPYASESGQYMDRSYKRFVDGALPIAIVHGWGDVSPVLEAKVGGERVGDRRIDEAIVTQCGNILNDPIVGSPIKALDHAKIQLGYGWLTQFSRFTDLESKLTGTVTQHHHSVGIVSSVTTIEDMCATYPSETGPYWIRDQSTQLDVLTGVSVTHKSGDASEENAAAATLALGGALLEGSIFEQQMDKADTASTVDRFEWANRQRPDDYFLLLNAANHDTAKSLLRNYPDNVFGLEEHPDDIAISAYIDEGYWVVVPQETALGPGRPKGPMRVDGSVKYNMALERGAAFVAFKPGGGDIAHVVHTAEESYSKGGGSGTEDADDQFDPLAVAALLNDTFEDRSTLHGVDLATGQFSFSPGPDITTGSGGFPYALSLQRTFRAGTSGSEMLGTGWTHNWDIRARISGSGLEAMGQSGALNAVSSLVALTVAHDLYKAAPSGLSIDALKYRLVPLFVHHWWREHLTYNVVNIAQGAAGTQFVRLPDGSFNPPTGSTAKLTQTGERVCGEPITDESVWDGPEALQPARQWHYNNIVLELKNPDGDVQRFEWWHAPGAGPGCNTGLTPGKPGGFPLSQWTFPTGVQITVTNTDGWPVRVENNLGRVLDIDFELVGNGPKSITAVKAESGTRQATFSYTTGGDCMEVYEGTTDPLCGNNAGTIARHLLTGVTTPDGATRHYQYVGNGLIPSAYEADARQHYMAHLYRLFAPSDGDPAADLEAKPHLQIEYDRLWRVRRLKDANALQVPSAE